MKDILDDIRPLKAPVEIRGGFPIWPIILLILLIISGFLVYMYLKKRKREEVKILEAPKRPQEIAMEGLKALLGMKLVEKGMIKQYYIRLSDILRSYIEGRYKIFALDMTTWELYQEMRFKKLERLHVDKIRDFLEDCDLVKFAKFIPSAKETEEAYQRAEEIVEVTTPIILDKSEIRNPKLETNPKFEI